MRERVSTTPHRIASHRIASHPEDTHFFVPPTLDLLWNTKYSLAKVLGHTLMPNRRPADSRPFVDDPPAFFLAPRTPPRKHCIRLQWLLLWLPLGDDGGQSCSLIGMTVVTALPQRQPWPRLTVVVETRLFQDNMVRLQLLNDCRECS
jgi:hypothetical protein